MPKKASKKKTGKNLSPEKGSSTKRCPYRVAGTQPLSVETPSIAYELSIQGVSCKLVVRPIHQDPADQLRVGGSHLVVEFEDSCEADLIVVTRRGLSLIEDFLSAISLVTGSTFQSTEALEVSRVIDGKCEFVMFKQLPAKHWHGPIGQDAVAKAKHLLAHWDGLEGGHRLRRAALQYREAIGNVDDTAAFQEAYIGLESMEPPLAKAAGLNPGTEELKGKCESCGYEFTRKKTTLVGVRSFVLDSLVADEAAADRKADWKIINSLRNDLMHGLIDPEELKDRPHRALIAAMHHLHAAICTCSHATDLVSSNYILARGGPTYVVVGAYETGSWPDLAEWSLALRSNEFSWVPHAEHHFVPQLSFYNDGRKDLEAGVGRLGMPLSIATMDSIARVPIERDEDVIPS